MPFDRRDSDRTLWFTEAFRSGVARTLRVKQVLANTQEGVQHIRVLDTEGFGTVLVIDDTIQVSTIPDLSAPYCEMLVHVPLFTHEHPRTGLVIGGGDFEVAREVLKHLCVEKLDVVDIDVSIGGTILTHMPEITGGAEHDPRLRLHYADGARFLEKVPPETYDFILVDSTSADGLFASLFSSRFVRMLYSALKTGGVMARQVGSFQFQSDDAPAHFRCVESVFDDTAVYLSSAPLYGDGDFGFVIGCKSPLSARRRASSARKAHAERNIGALRYYTSDVHTASFVLPPYVRNRLETVYGWELQLEICGCNLDKIDAAQICEQFVKELCETIGMERYGPFRFEDFGHQKLATSGPSFAQWIETSSIQAHISRYWDGLMFLDIFTCAPCDFQKAVCFARKFFDAKIAFGVLCERGSRRNMKKSKVHRVDDLRCSDECSFCRV